MQGCAGRGKAWWEKETPPGSARDERTSHQSSCGRADYYLPWASVGVLWRTGGEEMNKTNNWRGAQWCKRRDLFDLEQSPRCCSSVLDALVHLLFPHSSFLRRRLMMPEISAATMKIITVNLFCPVFPPQWPSWILQAQPWQGVESAVACGRKAG